MEPGASLRPGRPARKWQTCHSSRPIQPMGGRMIDVTVVLLSDGLPTTSIAPIEIFSYAGVLWNMLQGKEVQSLFTVRAASVDGRPPHSGLPVSVAPNAAIGDIDHTDLIVIPSGGLDIRKVCERNAAVVPWLRHWRERGAAIAGICTGVPLLAEAGLLDGKPATTHWAAARALHHRGRWRVLQRRAVCLHRPVHLPRGPVLRPRGGGADLQVVPG